MTLVAKEQPSKPVSKNWLAFLANSYTTGQQSHEQLNQVLFEYQVFNAGGIPCSLPNLM